eukprot:comp17271_c0_seq1/m.16362 comp17271_c0_seq1/g.16362  ORF comp17271_c0_seq1/g.16362 comp17271_c0_seq1/m.16362 type:complete len:343 (+) comp17271_c0_seq1:379-1407(+)
MLSRSAPASLATRCMANATPKLGVTHALAVVGAELRRGPTRFSLVAPNRVGIGLAIEASDRGESMEEGVPHALSPSEEKPRGDPSSSVMYLLYLEMNWSMRVRAPFVTIPTAKRSSLVILKSRSNVTSCLTSSGVYLCNRARRMNEGTSYTQSCEKLIASRECLRLPPSLPPSPSPPSTSPTDTSKVPLPSVDKGRLPGGVESGSVSLQLLQPNEEHPPGDIARVGVFAERTGEVLEPVFPVFPFRFVDILSSAPAAPSVRLAGFPCDPFSMRSVVAVSVTVLGAFDEGVCDVWLGGEGWMVLSDGGRGLAFANVVAGSFFAHADWETLSFSAFISVCAPIV